MSGSNDIDVKILLAHQPNIAKEASDRFNPQLSGHTHGGQFFPWNLITTSEITMIELQKN